MEVNLIDTYYVFDRPAFNLSAFRGLFGIIKSNSFYLTRFFQKKLITAHLVIILAHHFYLVCWFFMRLAGIAVAMGLNEFSLFGLKLVQTSCVFQSGGNLSEASNCRPISSRG